MTSIFCGGHKCQGSIQAQMTGQYHNWNFSGGAVFICFGLSATNL